MEGGRGEEGWKGEGGEAGGAMEEGGAKEGGGEMEGGGMVWSDGGRGTSEAHSPGLVVTHVHSWVLECSSSFVGVCLW